MSLLLQHFKRFGKLPLLFKENVYPVVTGETAKVSFKLPPEKALDYLRSKGKNIITTSSWNEIEANAYAKSFTVAKVMSADVVQEVFDYVLKAKEEGWSLKTFQDHVEKDGLLERMQQAGWTGKDASRLKVIYDTNMKMAAAKGKYDGLKLIADVKPFWVYKQVERKTKRHDHSTFHNKKFRHDDPIWTIIFPPSAFGCSCHVVATADGSGVESGSDYLDKVADSKDYTLSPLKQFEPDFDKYHSQIAEQLKSILDSRAKAKTVKLPYTQDEIQELIEKDELYRENLKYYDLSEIVKKLHEKAPHLDKFEFVALYSYTASSYKKLNRSLREGNDEGEVNIYKRILNSTLDKLDSFEGTVYRGQKITNDSIKEFIEAMSNNTVVELKHFLSTSTEPDIAHNFANMHEVDVNMVFEIKSKKGKEVSHLSKFSNEHEVLFKTGSKFHVTGIDLTKHIITLEEAD